MNTPQKRDSIFSAPLDKKSDFAFNHEVALVFDDMINRSVPGYLHIISQISLLAKKFILPETNCYDLGCSSGAVTNIIRKAAKKSCKVIAVDNSISMLRECKKRVVSERSEIPVSIICSDLQNIKIQSASFVVLNFTLQFIPIQHRKEVIQNIYNGLVPGGALILSEKIAFSDEKFQSLFTDLHHDFKRANGYSELEISQKRDALENVLIPETADKHKDRLISAGFKRCEVWFQSFNFVSLIAVKSSS